ncbi:MAG: hypothetical protein U5K79_15540 [Cyclobacteriaceae bacterium]|nr:hypothetical protein [Cyclobacteriaceae bacterium]
MKKNKKFGGKCILEHPMPYVDYWMGVNESFYRDPDILIKPGYSRFSRGVIKRMKEECSTADFIQVHSSFVRGHL